MIIVNVIETASYGETDTIGKHFWGAKGAPILFSEIGFCVASCSYIYYIYNYYI